MPSSRNLLDKLIQMKQRGKGKKISFPPPSSCHDTHIHIAGVFLMMHIDEIIEAVRNARETS